MDVFKSSRVKSALDGSKPLQGLTQDYTLNASMATATRSCYHSTRRLSTTLKPLAISSVSAASLPRTLSAT
eukprot:7075805-Prymnesium_polylepis.1